MGIMQKAKYKHGGILLFAAVPLHGVRVVVGLG